MLYTTTTVLCDLINVMCSSLFQYFFDLRSYHGPYKIPNFLVYKFLLETLSLWLQGSCMIVVGHRTISGRLHKFLASYSHDWKKCPLTQQGSKQASEAFRIQPLQMTANLQRRNVPLQLKLWISGFTKTTRRFRWPRSWSMIREEVAR